VKETSKSAVKHFREDRGKMNERKTQMIRKSILPIVVLMATLLPMGLSARGGGGTGGSFTSYNTTWSLSCTSNTTTMGGVLTLYTKKFTQTAIIDCLSPSAIGDVFTNTDIVNTVGWAPTNWTFSPNTGLCFDSKGNPMAAISGAVGSQVGYNCYPVGGSKAGPVISSGKVGTAKPVGQP
jgi:hypothetical protein